MGNSPCTLKEFDEGGNDRVHFAACALKGWREYMEDFRCAHLNLNGADDLSFFGVFDGHGGKDVAHFASENLHRILLEQECFGAKQYEMALKAAYMKADKEIKFLSNFDHNMCGSTAVTCLLVGDILYCANAGDSRAVLSRDGKAVDLSTDHKPNLPKEKQRIECAGGVIHQNRVNGELSMSRALGDHCFKKGFGAPDAQEVIALPDVTVHQVDEHDDFVLLASDGVWDAVNANAGCWA